MHYGAAADPKIFHVDLPHVTVDSSPFQCFGVMSTDEFFSVMLTEQNHYYQRYVQEDLQAYSTIDEAHHFMAVIILIGRNSRDATKDHTAQLTSCTYCIAICICKSRNATSFCM